MFDENGQPVKDIECAIIDILAEVHGIPRRKLSTASRLVQDLGVDGDDAVDLLNRLQETFGTDFSALHEQWSIFFAAEGMSPRAMLGCAGLFKTSAVAGAAMYSLLDLHG